MLTKITAINVKCLKYVCTSTRNVMSINSNNINKYKIIFLYKTLTCFACL